MTTDALQTSVVEHHPVETSPRAWVAQTWLRSDGRRAETGERGAVCVFAACVYEQVSADPEVRLGLLREIGQGFASQVSPDAHSLWVFPGGYFGFDAARRNWIDLTDADMRAIQRRMLSEVLPLFPAWSSVVVGMDPDDRQFAWIGQTDSNHRATVARNIQRHHTDLPDRRFLVGELAASCFVCGEFCGSRTANNGAYYEDVSPALYLDEPVRQLADSRLLIDLAHSRVSGTVNAASAPPRLSHQRQLERFATHGAGLLVHHHGGLMTGGRAANKHQSGWIIYRGGRWIEDGAISALR